MSEPSENVGKSDPHASDPSTTVEIQQPSANTVPEAPAHKEHRHRRRVVLITIPLVVIILAVAGFGGYQYAMHQYNQLSSLGAQLCDNLEAHRYGVLYQHFSTTLKAQYSQEEFIRYGTEIDQFEGNVLSCGQTAGNRFNIDVGQRTIAVASFLDREGSGRHSGSVRFQFTGNSWAVDGFDAGFLGVSLGALQAFDAYCGALRARDYRAYYQLLAPNLRTESEQQFLNDAFLHQEIDGLAIQCTLAGIGKSNTDTRSTLTVDIQRVITQVSGAVTFTRSVSGDWVLSAVNPVLPGRDLKPVTIVERWCSDMKSENYADAFGLLTSSAQAGQGNSASALGARFSGKDGGVKWLDCTVDPTTYSSNDNYVSLVAAVHHTGATLVPGLIDRAIFFLSLEQGTWKINLLFICASAQCGE